VHEENTTVLRQSLGQQSRILALAPGIQSHVLSIAPDRNTPTTWLIQATNAVDGNAPLIALTINQTGPSGVLVPILTQIGPRESVQLYATGAVNIVAIALLATTLEISVTAIGGGLIPVPPITHTANPGFVAYVAASGNSGYAPPGRRYFTMYGSQDFDMQFIDTAGAVVFDSPGNVAPAPAGPTILPPGVRLMVKGNVAAATISTVWTQSRGM